MDKKEREQSQVPLIEIKISRRFLLFFAFLILSILLHLLMVGTFFHYSFSNKAVALWTALTKDLTPEQKQELAKQVKKKREKILEKLQSIKRDKKDKHSLLNNLPAKLRAPKSQFGWVLFDEPPNKKPALSNQQIQIPTTIDGPVGEATASVATEGTPSGIIARSPSTATPVQASEPTPQTQEAIPAKQQKPIKAKKRLPTKTKSRSLQKKRRQAPSMLQEQKPADIKTPIEVVSSEKKQVPPDTQKALETEKDQESQQKTDSLSTDQEAMASETSQETEIKEIGQEVTASEVDKGEQSIAERIASIKEFQGKIAAFEEGKLPITAARASASSTTKTQQIAAQADRMIGGADGIRVRGAHSETQKPQRNIIALTRGFVEKIDGEEGTDLIDRDGDPNKRPSFEELKYLSYESKLNWCLQAAWKQNFCYRPMAKPLEGDAIVEFILDEHGNLKESTLLQSTGYPELDTMIMKNMKFASPFPPIPKHFGTSTYRTGRIIQVRTNKFNF